MQAGHDAMYSHLTFPKEPIPIVFPRRYCPRMTGTLSIFYYGQLANLDVEVSKEWGRSRNGLDNLNRVDFVNELKNLELQIIEEDHLLKTLA